jgi:hypothetical protein
MDRPAWLAGPLILVHDDQIATSPGVQGGERRGVRPSWRPRRGGACRILNPRLGDVRREKHGGAWSSMEHGVWSMEYRGYGARSTDHEAIDHRSLIIDHEVLSIVSECPSGRQR